MELKEMISQAEQQFGTVRALAKELGIRDANLTAAKNGKRSIPDEACAKLAAILKITYGEVAAARNYAMAKDQNQRDFWLPFVRSNNSLTMPPYFT